jgi:CHASE1-domain containing sensor protein
MNSLLPKQISKVPGLRFMSSRIFLTLLPIITLLLVPIISITVYTLTLNQVNSSLLLEFDASSNGFNNSVSDRLNYFKEGFIGIQGLYAASTTVERGEWRKYLEQVMLLQRYPGLSSVAYLERTTDKTGLESEFQNDALLKKEGINNIKIYPSLDKEEYYVIKYIEPISSLSNLIGFDASSDATRLSYIVKARDTGEPVLTSQVRSASDNMPVFMIYLPEYFSNSDVSTLEARRANIQGVIAGTFNPQAFFADLVGKSGISNRLAIKIYDTDDLLNLTKSNLIFDNNTNLGNDTLKLNKSQTYQFFGHRWVFDLTYLPDSADNQLLLTPKLRLVAVSFGGMLIFVLVYIFANRGRTVRELAADLSEKIFYQQKVMDRLMENYEEAILVVNSSGRIVYVNKALSELCQKSVQDLTDKQLLDPQVPEYLRAMEPKFTGLFKDKQELLNQELKLPDCDRKYSYTIKSLLHDGIVAAMCTIKLEKTTT